MQTMSMERQAPDPRPWGVSEDEAVELCREWMVYLGADDAVATSGETRAVCSLYSARFLAWVDNRQHNLNVDMVERASTVAAADGRHPLVFIPGGVLPTAQDRADELGVALLRFDAQNADLDGANAVGRRLRATGFLVG